MIIAANLLNHESELIKSVIDNTRSRNDSFNIMPPGDRFQFHSYNYHLTCVRASTFVTFHAYNCLSKCLKIITCFKKQTFSLNQFKLLPSTGLSYRSAVLNLFRLADHFTNFFSVRGPPKKFLHFLGKIPEFLTTFFPKCFLGSRTTKKNLANSPNFLGYFRVKNLRNSNFRLQSSCDTIHERVP